MACQLALQAPYIFMDKTHAMENFTPWVEQVAHDAQKALSITKPDVPKMTKPGRGGPQI